MQYKTHNQIRIKSPWTIEYLRNLELIVKPNEHAVCNFKATIDRNDLNKIDNDLENEPISLLVYEDFAWKTIFYGYLEDIKMYKQNEFLTLEVRAVSATKKLDLKKLSKSFQDINMTYEDLVTEVIKNKDNIDAIFAENSSKKTGMSVIQYAETDWEFLKRMASHFNTVIIPDLSCDKSRFWFGIPDGANHTLTKYELCNVCDDKELFNILSLAKNDIDEMNCLAYIVKTPYNFEIGDNINFINTTLKVYDKHAEFIEDLWIYTYKLVFPKSIFTKRQYNNKICGMSIIGKVIDTAGQRLKIHLDIDKTQEKSKAYWYDYTPQTGNSMYCMPKIGTNVSLYFRDEKEEHARAVSCVRNNGSTCSKMSDYNNRSFTTEHNKVMNMLPQKIDFIGGEEGNPLKLTLSDGEAISFTSDNALIMSGDNDITFKAGKNISLKAAGSVSLAVCDGKSQPDTGVITIDIEVNILGVNVKLMGEESVSLPSIEDNLKRKELDVGKLITNVLIGVAVVCAVAAIAAFALPALAAAAGVATISSTAIFATVVVGGSIPIAIQAGKDIHKGENSDWVTYARIGAVNSLGTALALLPFGGILAKFGLNKVGQILLGSGGAGLFSALCVGYLDNGLQGQLYNPLDDKLNLVINTVGNMLPDVGELFRSAGKKTAEEAAKETAETLTGSVVKQVVRTSQTIDRGAVFAAYGIKNSNGNINILKKAIMENPEAFINIVVADKQMAKEVLSDPTLCTEVLQNTIPLVITNAGTNKETLGDFIYGKYPTYSYQ